MTDSVSTTLAALSSSMDQLSEKVAKMVDLEKRNALLASRIKYLESEIDRLHNRLNIVKVAASHWAKVHHDAAECDYEKAIAIDIYDEDNPEPDRKYFMNISQGEAEMLNSGEYEIETKFYPAD